ncbi:PREDICTED: GEM-like protein 5 [Nelumbo nucifera]|uniref:GEM-like protein 5 n=2 Tax=Nelumbo nucifera TaxID=4432 RepID=A0A1U7Z749_NELNU|nr:PREDICTED: GEM-like protein 5 [Nelumbo nucifera]DAD30453.1 TPA_asm: hypothetical protein HUJ06_009304 [Nelumbo nucifera]
MNTTSSCESAKLHQPSAADEGEAQQTHQSCSSSSIPAASDASAVKWGTYIMGPPVDPSSHPDNKKAALWKAEDYQQKPHPYLQYSPVDKPSNNSLEPVIHLFNSWSRRAETLARNIWQNIKMGQSVSGAAWAKVNLTAKAITEGGFESLYKQTFTNDPNEKLKKTFACYLSTSTGPVAGTLYLTNVNIAFCSDRPLSFTAPSGQEAWSYYKVMVPWVKISTINPISMVENPSEKYIQVITVDVHEFWFMGFVNHEKATRHLSNTLSEFSTSQRAVQPTVR